MKKVVFLAILSCICGTFALADTYVNGYTRKDGTYVVPHYRSDPDSSPYNNYSTQGNTNPYTGKRGSKSPYDY